jgi:hypothetical protein
MLRIERQEHKQLTDNPSHRYTTKTSKGIIIRVPFYEQLEQTMENYLSLPKAQKRGVKTRGKANQFVVLEDIDIVMDDRIMSLKAGDVFLDNFRAQKVVEPVIEVLFGTGRTKLSYAEWRMLRFEIDELFILQKQIPE